MKNNIENQENLLIRSLKNGSQKAFNDIYRMYAKRLYVYSLQFTKSPEESEEIIQDVFIRLWTNREKIRQEDTVRSLLFIMVKHQIMNAFRAKANHPLYEEYINYKDTISTDDALYQLEYRDFVLKLEEAMGKLPATQRKVIILAKMEQLSNKEIAEKLSLSEQTVKNQLSMGLKSLKEHLGNLYYLVMLFFIN